MQHCVAMQLRKQRKNGKNIFQLLKLRTAIHIKEKHDMLASWNIAILKSKLSHVRWCNVLISSGYKTWPHLSWLSRHSAVMLKVILNITLL